MRNGLPLKFAKQRGGGNRRKAHHKKRKGEQCGNFLPCSGVNALPFCNGRQKAKGKHGYIRRDKSKQQKPSRTRQSVTQDNRRQGKRKAGRGDAVSINAQGRRFKAGIFDPQLPLYKNALEEILGIAEGYLKPTLRPAGALPPGGSECSS